MNKKKTIILLVMNLIVAICTIAAITLQFCHDLKVFPGFSIKNFDMFRMFTNDGSAFTMAVCLISAFFCIRSLKAGTSIYPQWVSSLRLMSAVSETVIILVVMALLVPQQGAKVLTGFYMIVMHIMNPIIVVATFILLDPQPEHRLKPGKGPLPLMIYAILAMTLCAAGIWTGRLIPYTFLDVRNNPIWMTGLYVLGILGGAFLISLILVKCKKLIRS